MALSSAASAACMRSVRCQLSFASSVRVQRHPSPSLWTFRSKRGTKSSLSLVTADQSVFGRLSWPVKLSKRRGGGACMSQWSGNAGQGYGGRGYGQTGQNAYGAAGQQRQQVRPPPCPSAAQPRDDDKVPC